MTKFAFVAAEQANHAVATLGRISGASVSDYYAWRRAIPAVQNRVEAETELRDHIGRVHVSPASIDRFSRRHGSCSAVRRAFLQISNALRA